MRPLKKTYGDTGKITISSVLLVSTLLVLVGLGLIKYFSFPSYEQEKEYNDLKYLAQLEGKSVDEYVKSENDRSNRYAQERLSRERIVDAIHLNMLDELPSALAGIKESYADNYTRWPYLYSEAIKANNLSAFKWLIDNDVPCDYKIHSLGGMAIYMAIERKERNFFEEFLKNGCDISNSPKQEPLRSKIKRMRDKDWLELFNSYYSDISLDE